MTDSIALRKAWEEHPRYRYRGCAPDVDEPLRAAGNLELTLDAWSGVDREGSEPQKEREARQAAAIDVCFGCAVMVQCAAYANSITADGRLAEPDGIWGGETALARHKALIAARHAAPAAPDRRFETPQKRAILRALAVCWGPAEVAQAAELPDVRTANWQRSSLVRLLGLPKDASRMQVLEAARVRGLLDGVEVVPDDGSVPAIPPATEDLLMEVRGQLLLWPSKRSEVTGHARRVRGRGPRRAVSLRMKFLAVEGQVDLDVAELDGLADVRDLFCSERLETAA
jgi:hypothetical protein